MASNFECEWCSGKFRTEPSLEWHTEDMHLKEAGPLLTMDPKWQGVPTYTAGMAGEWYIVVPSRYLQHAQDLEELADAYAKDGARDMTIVRALKGEDLES